MLQVELKVLGGKQAGKLLPITGRKFLIGREADCHLRPVSESVSRHHCVFSLDDYTVRIRDLGSTNGTFVNGERVQGQRVLADGDTVGVGKLSFQMVIRQVAAVGSGGTTIGATTIGGEAAAESVLDPALAEDTSQGDTGVHDTPNAAMGSDTTVMGVYNPAAPAPIPTQIDMTATGSYVMPPGYGQPPGYPPPGMMPGYPPPGYPPQMPGYGYPPGYAPPPYPGPGYGGYPPPGYPGAVMPPVQAAPVQAAPPTPAVAKPAPSATDIPEVRLPDPSDTGAKEGPLPGSSGSPTPAAGGPVAANPSNAAADIIRSHMQRRKPGT